MDEDDENTRLTQAFTLPGAEPANSQDSQESQETAPQPPEPWGRLIAQVKPSHRAASPSGAAAKPNTGPASLKKRVDLTKDVIAVGRSRKECDVVVRDKHLTSVHFRLYRVLEQPTGLAPQSKTYIKDNNSMNGTFVNRKRLEPHKRRVLHQGDEIAFSKHATNHWLYISTVAAPPTPTRPGRELAGREVTEAGAEPHVRTGGAEPVGGPGAAP
eukprot:g3604.t1